MALGDDGHRWDLSAQEDIIGQDRLARSLLRLIGRMEPATLVTVHGAPGSGKSEFVRRLAWLASQGRGKNVEQYPGLFPGVAVYDPWAWSKQGSLLSGLVSALVRAAVNPQVVMERARELVSRIGRLRFDGGSVEGAALAFSGVEADPVDQLADGFGALVSGVKAGRPGRLLIFIDEMDSLSPAQRWQLIDGVRLLMRSKPEVTVIFSVGRESLLAALRHREGDIPESSAMRELDEIIDLSVTVPSLEVRRIGTLLREYIGNAEGVVRRSFGNDAITHLSPTVMHRPLGAPRFLKRLAFRVVLLAEFAQEVRQVRELTEAQWAWVVISERWPEFRRFMIRGGRDRWIELKHAMARLSMRGDPRTMGNAGATIFKWLEGDLILADYLRLYADGFDEDADGIFWLESMMLTAGL